jgi:hypothetical protein
MEPHNDPNTILLQTGTYNSIKRMPEIDTTHECYIPVFKTHFQSPPPLIHGMFWAYSLHGWVGGVLLFPICNRNVFYLMNSSKQRME